ncbi:PAS domain S-box protein [Pseudomonas sp. TH49]|uniref:methyl-accepting chemotaxis protein n=1 Tax=Pseudomonas sp. TH49 TaxID=2796413 RepID=UPI0019133611|nr:methyl-accepting chemotaxis protein [Pseudomonas sp. TH49]MBK5342596.1 PAS domain S-box protein [Pseudomonas sp. TH49]
MFFNRHQSALNDLQHTITEQNGLLEAINRSMAVIEFDLDGVVLKANDNFLKTMGYRAEQVIGQPHRLFCTPEFGRSAQYTELWSRLKNGQFQSGTFERVDSKGQPIWLEANYNPVYDASGRLCKVVKFATDVTTRVEQHEQDARSASAAYHISVETRKVAEQGTQVIQQAASEMREIADDIAQSSTLIAQLGERSEQITAIVNTIRAIADQTNLLALNAAIEAARAGDQGRGFAVVADEVRQLAARTSGSTAEISNMIGLIQSETRQAIKSMEDTRGRAAQGVELADQAGSVILQIRDGASEAVQAVSMFANERAPG